MKDQDSLWIISTLNWYYKFSKSIVISVFTLSYYYYFLYNLYGDCARHPTSDPSLPTGRTDLLHVWPTPGLRGLDNLGNLRLYDKIRVGFKAEFFENFE